MQFLPCQLSVSRQDLAAMVNVKCPSFFTFSHTFLKDFIETMQKQTMKTSVLKPKRY